MDMQSSCNYRADWRNIYMLDGPLGLQLSVDFGGRGSC